MTMTEFVEDENSKTFPLILMKQEKQSKSSVVNYLVNLLLLPKSRSLYQYSFRLSVQSLNLADLIKLNEY